MLEILGFEEDIEDVVDIDDQGAVVHGGLGVGELGEGLALRREAEAYLGRQ